MIVLLILLGLLIQLVVVWAVFYFEANRTVGCLVSIVAAILCSVLITPWSLLLGIPIILASVIVLIAPLRDALVSRPAFNILSKAKELKITGIPIAPIKNKRYKLSSFSVSVLSSILSFIIIRNT